MREILNEYYGSRDEEGRLLTRHGRVELLTTVRYIEKYLKPGDRIIEIGAGTGRYSRHFAGRGYSVDAVELTEHNIGIFKGMIRENEQITVSRGDATDLRGFPDEKYDIALLLGPMYHLFTAEEQKKALAEAIRVTKKGGVVFAAYCMGDASVLSYGFIRGHVREIIEACMLDPETFETFSNPRDIFELYRKEKIDALMEGFRVQRLHFVAADGYANYMRESLAEMDGETYELYLKYHFATCERQDMTGYSHHTLDIFRKEG